MTTRRSSLPHLEWNGRRDQAMPAAAELVPMEMVLCSGSAPSPAEWRDLLILGDNQGVMASLLSEFEAAIDLIYADPPFLSGKRYRSRIGRSEDSRRPADWETVEGYPDAWQDPAAYLDMLAPRLRLMYRLLSPTGTLYLHLDWHAAAYARILLDELFGSGRLLNEIIWIYHGPSAIRSAFKRKHDVILVYTKSDRYTFNADSVRVPYDASTRRTFASSPKAGFGRMPDLDRGKVPEDWWYFPVVARLHKERTGYPTQKPEALMERILTASSNPGDLVADFFCGSGTTPVVAGRLGRRWIAADSGSLALATTHRRLLLQARTGPFQLLSTPGASVADGPSFGASLTQSGGEVALRLVTQPPAQLEEVEFWEIDWDWDGREFISRSQGVRRWRSPELPDLLTWSYASPGDRKIRSRVVDRLGRASFLTLPVSIQAA